MRYVRYRDIHYIPNHLIEDVLELSRVIITELNIYISQLDLYKVWSSFSYDMKCSWVPIDFFPEEESRAEFLENILSHYCEEVDPRNLT